MIVAETSTAYRFITQPDHARLAGVFAARWGSSTFEAPRPVAAVVPAAVVHDLGWILQDRRPRLTEDGLPQPFTDLSPDTWISIYDRGIKWAIEVDRYAGILVSMHGTGLRRRRYGLSPSWPDTPAAFRDFVDRHEARQQELARELADDPTDRRVAPGDVSMLSTLHETGAAHEGSISRLWTNYRLLQAWDALSLACCTTTKPPGRDTIDNVPTRPDGPIRSLSLGAGAGEGIIVDPYPFDADPLIANVPAKTVRKGAFDTEQELAMVYATAEQDTMELEFRSSF